MKQAPDLKHNWCSKKPEHDSPQTISYTRIGPDSLVAEISGAKKRAGAQAGLPDEMPKVNALLKKPQPVNPADCFLLCGPFL